MLSSAVFMLGACGACYAYIESLRGGKGGFPFNIESYYNGVLTFLDNNSNVLCL